MRIKSFRHQTRFLPQPLSKGGSITKNKPRSLQHAESEGQKLTQAFRDLSTYFKDFTPMNDVYAALLSPSDLSFLFATQSVLVVLERKRDLLEKLRATKLRDVADAWENPPDFSSTRWMAEVFRQRLHSLVRRKNDANPGTFKPLVILYREILDDLNARVVNQAETLIFAIRRQVDGWWKGDDASRTEAEEALFESVMDANDLLEKILGQMDARYIGNQNLAAQRRKEAFNRYSGVGVEMQRLTGNRLDLPGPDKIGDSVVLKDFFLNLFDFFSFQTWIRETIARTPTEFFVGDFGSLTVDQTISPNPDLAFPEGFVSPEAEKRALKRVIKTYLIKQRDDHNDCDRIRPVLSDWLRKLEATRFQSTRTNLQSLKNELDPRVEEMDEQAVEAEIGQNIYILGKGLIRMPIDKKYLFFTLKRLAADLPGWFRQFNGASEFRDFPTHHLSPVKKLYFISACRMMAFLAELKNLETKLAANLTFADLDQIYPELIRIQTPPLIAQVAQVQAPAPASKQKLKPPTLLGRLLEEIADLESLLKSAGKIYSQMLNQFQTGNVEPIVGLAETAQALRITYERAQRAKPANLGG